MHFHPNEQHMTDSHGEGQDHIEVVKCICLCSDELFKAGDTENRKTNPCEFLKNMILSANILSIS